MPDATFARPDLTTFAGLDDLGLEVTGQLLEPGRAVLACRVTDPDDWCRRCGCQGRARDTVVRALAHEPMGWRPTTLLVTVRRYRCTGCGHVWRHDTTAAAAPRATLSRAGLRWALTGLVVGHLTVARVAEALGVAWHTANAAVLAEGRGVLIDDPARFGGVTTIGDAVDRCRRRVQTDLHGHRGRTGDPLYISRRTLHTGADLLTDAQRARLDALFAIDEHVQVQATWAIYQKAVAAYRAQARTTGKQLMSELIDSLRNGIPAAPTELGTLGRTLEQRAEDVLAYFDRPGTSSGPTEAINGRLEHLRGSALGFRNLTNYIARSLLETGGFRSRLHPQLR